MKKHYTKGFSLIELLVVIAIIGLLSTMAVISLNNARTKARDTRRMGDIKALQTAIEMYKTQNNTDLVPTSADWSTLGTNLSAYMTAAPNDPTNTGTTYSYVYCRNATLPSKYLVATVLEQTLTVPGDINFTFPLASTTAWTCIKSNASVLHPAGTPTQGVTCADNGAGMLTTATANQTVFCLGQMQ